MIPIRIIVADDQVIFREGFKTLFSQTPEMEIVDDVSNGAQLVAAVERLRPDVVFCDIRMPVLSGIEATKIIHERWPEVPVIGMSSFDHSDSILGILNAGAVGYIRKYCTREVVLEAARAAARGGTYHCTDTSRMITSLVISKKIDPRTLEPVGLDATEKRIVRWICEGKETAEIAGLLNVSVGSVNRYRIEIAQKTSTKNMAELAIYAVRHSIFEL
jgi:DNA-binding NarL/FixJ family response regulator